MPDPLREPVKFFHLMDYNQVCWIGFVGVIRE